MPRFSPFMLGAAAATLALCHASTAFADAQQIGTSGSWAAYASRAGKAANAGPDVCYISSRPIAGQSKSHAGVFAEVTHRPAEHHIGVIDILESGPFKPGAPASLAVGSESFTLFTHGVAAFAKDEDDARIVSAMRAASAGGSGGMVFTGTDKKGKPLREAFSLVGMEQAYQSIGKACHVPTGAPPRATVAPRGARKGGKK